jgi:hypothetical protein
MKKIKHIIAIMIFFSIPVLMIAQPPRPPHPNGGFDPNTGGTSNTPVGGGTTAPIDGGLSILLALGLAYGAKKVYQAKKED